MISRVVSLDRGLVCSGGVLADANDLLELVDRGGSGLANFGQRLRSG